MDPDRRLPHFYWLPERLWADSGAMVRSGELTPLHVERAAGLRSLGRLTRHRHWEWFYVLSGEGELLGDAPDSLSAGTACLIPPGVRHIEHSEEQIEIIWIGLDGHMVQAAPDQVLVMKGLDELRETVLEFWELSHRPEGLTGPELDSLARCLLGRFLRAGIGALPPGAGRVERIMHFLNEHYSEDVAMSEVAETFGMSPRHFYREFQTHCGMTPLEYLTEVRMRNALRYLRDTDLPIYRIAQACGFNQPRQFSRACRQVIGQTPTEIRRGAK